MKAVVLIGIAIILGVGAYWYMTPDEGPNVPVAEETDTSNTPVVTTTAPAQIAVFENNDYGFTFDYRIKPYGYSIFENTIQQNLELGTLFGVTLVRSDDYNESVSAAAAGNAHDGPPSMSVYVFSAGAVLDLPAWLTTNRMLTNCMEGSVIATVLSGSDANSCLWDGLYPGVTIAQKRDNKIYVLVGTRESAETPDGYSYEKDFNALVESFAASR